MAALRSILDANADVQYLKNGRLFITARSRWNYFPCLTGRHNPYALDL
ncbi:hypothetical protein MES4922_130053 [Mesorhizobium ventifaucium]|uniref:Uncharacterized protein n=1 Tax=Mesorhizobium ventifaucium TaxID=666020 RepID=A0ABN8JC25_9HYPH|nr:hypothetical protein MES4922_130053 [Mesorhizobium ventifaucium]